MLGFGIETDDNLQVEDIDWFESLKENASTLLELVELLERTSDDDTNAFRIQNCILKNRTTINNIKEALEEESFADLVKYEDNVLEIMESLKNEVIEKHRVKFNKCKSSLDIMSNIFGVKNEFKEFKRLDEFNQIKKEYLSKDPLQEVDEYLELYSKALEIFKEFEVPSVSITPVLTVRSSPTAN